MPASRRPALYRDDFDRLILEPFVFQEGRVVFDEESSSEAEAFWDSSIKPLSNYASICVLGAVLSMVAVILTKFTLLLFVAQAFVLTALAILMVRTAKIKTWMSSKGIAVDGNR